MKQKYLLLILITLLLTICKTSFSSDLSLCKTGWDRHLSGHDLKAIELYQKCIKEGKLSKKDLARTYRNIGISYKDIGKYKMAIRYYNKGIKLKPKDLWSDYVNRGNAWDLLGLYQKALDDYDKAIKEKGACTSNVPKNIISIVHSPECGEIFYNRGISYENQKMIQKAKDDFLTAYKLGLRSDKLAERFKYHNLFKKIK